MYDQSCSTSDPKRSWSVKIGQIENVTVKKTLAGFSLSLGLVCNCVSAKNVGSSLYLDLKKGFVVAAITLFVLRVRPTTSNLISPVKLLMLSIWFNVACVEGMRDLAIFRGDTWDAGWKQERDHWLHRLMETSSKTVESSWDRQIASVYLTPKIQDLKYRSKHVPMRGRKNKQNRK